MTDHMGKNAFLGTLILVPLRLTQKGLNVATSMLIGLSKLKYKWLFRLSLGRLQALIFFNGAMKMVKKKKNAKRLKDTIKLIYYSFF